jgi:hypothetical protein
MKTNLIGISGKIGSGKVSTGIIIDMSLEGFSEKTIVGFVKRNQFNGYHFEIKKFESKKMEITCLLLGCTMDQLEDEEFKDKELGEEWNKYEVKGLYSRETMDSEFSDYEEFVDYFSTEKEATEFALSEEKLLNVPKEERQYGRSAAYDYTIVLVKITPRKLLQLLDTEAGREIIHPNIWVNAFFAGYSDRQFRGSTYESQISNWIVTDVKYPNQAKAIKDRGGIIIRVNRDYILRGVELPFIKDAQHPSETALDDYEFDHVIDNDGSIEELLEKVKLLKLV